jgi:hypothetical protein
VATLCQTFLLQPRLLHVLYQFLHLERVVTTNFNIYRTLHDAFSEVGIDEKEKAAFSTSVQKLYPPPPRN